MKVTSTEVQNNFGKYLKIASELEDVVITRNGKEIASIISCSDRNTVDEGAVNFYFNDQGKVSYEEFLELTKNSDVRYEYINGQVYVLASPSYRHQIAVDEIFVNFYNWFKGKKCRPLTSPFDVTLVKNKTDFNVVQPDIIVICDTNMVDENGKYQGVPTLVVEVISKSTKKKDMLKKLDLYMETGIKEYWLVDPIKEAIQLYVFEDGDIKDYGIYTVDKSIKSEIFEGLEIKLEDIFRAGL